MSQDEGISLSVPSFGLGSGPEGACGDSAGSREESVSGAPIPAAGTFWHDSVVSGSIIPNILSCPKDSGGLLSTVKCKSRAVTVAYVVNSELTQPHTAENMALHCLKDACDSVGSKLEIIHFGKIDFGETCVLDQFYNADIAVVEMTDAFRQPSLFYHLGVRESFSMANNIILYCDTNSDSLQSLQVSAGARPYWLQ
ncbi:mitogen-activated protein kinase kinase kinase 5-like [Salvelinus namaycush]|uniref:Mitogen-activated protein kinase kinase kinase 5-like n=1 Tax=Salvelinus namaycush TaxID=8040 RepID=A0A8U0PHR6_SALNM|nr:mitogen-activated protein kinase kinase kinase 5-like [Salvelinus namaycush]